MVWWLAETRLSAGLELGWSIDPCGKKGDYYGELLLMSSWHWDLDVFVADKDNGVSHTRPG